MVDATANQVPDDELMIAQNEKVTDQLRIGEEVVFSCAIQKQNRFNIW